MFDTPVINVAIGLVFCFAATALAASTITEVLASLIKLRANSLVTGVQQMLNDPKFSGLALQVYNHALVHPQGNGAMDSGSGTWSYKGPSYIKAENFATAMIDVLSKVPGDVTQLQASIKALPDPQLQQLLGGMLARAQNNVDHLHQQIADWFDTAMDRVSGAYKRQAQMISFLAALVLAVTINIDATRVMTTLWKNPTLAREIAMQAGAAVQTTSDFQVAKQQLETLPVGPELLQHACDGRELKCFEPEVGCMKDGKPCVATRITGYNLLGWLITAVAAVFGAPFWFDLLGKLVQLRGAGPKPEEKKAR